MAQQPMMLQGFQPPLGPQPMQSGLYSPQPVTLVLKERILSWSGDDFHVTTTTGQPVLIVKGKVMSLTGRTTFTTLNGQEIFQVQKKLFRFPMSFRGTSPQGFDFEVKGHFKLMGSKSTVLFKNAADGSPIELGVKGDWLDRKAEITLDGRPVANISREFWNARQMLGGQQTYYVTIAPGVDLSLMAAICVCLDEREKENNGS